ncbi:TPA: hypothetical protein JYW32_004550 [Escherichia coli]|nr:hypothetical protein [Escherichia coli]
MSKLLDRFRYFKQKGETFADGHGQVMHSNRDWEDSYRQRWQFDKIVRSTHGVNCTLQRYRQSIFASVRGSSWQRNRRGITTPTA